MAIVNALSVDVEDWFQVGAFETTIDRADWDSLELRVEANTDRILALFAAAGVSATFFTLGWIAERCPQLIARIAAAGHEVASHGWEHGRVFRMTPAAFRADLARARAAIEAASGQQVRGYRAPSFSIDRRTPWAHPVLAEEGYAYSSSVAPLHHDHYGWPGAPRGPWHPVEDSDFVELPVTLARFLGRDVTTGGGFFRLLPASVTDRAIDAANDAERSAVFYFHPWEIDPGQPRVKDAPLKSKLRHYSRLGAMRGKLAGLLTRHPWDRVDHVLGMAQPTLA